MKKVAIIGTILCAMFLGVKSADAQVPSGIRTYSIIGSSITASVVYVSSSAATQIDTTAVLMTGRTYFEIQNQDASNAIYCSPKSTVTTTTGRAITAGSSWIISITDSGDNGRLTLYCITSNSSAASRAILIQGR